MTHKKVCGDKQEHQSSTMKLALFAGKAACPSQESFWNLYDCLKRAILNF